MDFETGRKMSSWTDATRSCQGSKQFKVACQSMFVRKTHSSSSIVPVLSLALFELAIPTGRLCLGLDLCLCGLASG